VPADAVAALTSSRTTTHSQLLAAWRITKRRRDRRRLRVVPAAVQRWRMNSDELRNLQAPLKDRYRSDPAAALVTLNARGRIGQGATCGVETGRALVAAGLHPATGGTGTLACSGDMLLEALAACAGVTLSAVATALDIPVKDGTVHVEGDLDVRGTLGVAKDASVGFARVRVGFELQTDATDEQLATLLRLTERYCVVYQTLRQPPAVELTCRRAETP
jgi:uncharacterized OsmC-like protein